MRSPIPVPMHIFLAVGLDARHKLTTFYILYLQTFTTLCTTRALTPACFCDVSHLLQRRVAASSTRPFDHAVIAPASSISRRNYQRRGVLWTFYTQRAGRLRRLVPDVVPRQRAS
ncbi:hypothetical protein B0H19DRAFT_381092 [Mycena capillaripes]|nr:hypothetical protein B0H19DRAFT_381092 [Mycena capillaripes]